MTVEDDFVATIHRWAVQWLVACGDAADHPDHPDAAVAFAARQMAHKAVLTITYQVPSYRGWEIHRAVSVALSKRRVRRVLDPGCPYCRVVFAMDSEAAKTAELERLERVRLLTGASD